ncbi:hypothetical protein H1R20_g14926, partial [Candolleomyces eurysporus]
MVTATATLGGTAFNVKVGRIAHGLMNMTWTPNPAPDEQCFEAIRAAVDVLPPGAKMVLNSGEFYAQDWGTGNLQLLSRFYAKHPEYAEKTFLSVKGGVKNRGPDCSIENLRASIDNIQSALGPIKKVDLFQPARVDSRIPIEKQMENLVTLLKEGKFDHIGLSECNADTLRRAHAVYPVTAAEIEVSPWSYDENQKKVIETSKELGISVMAYSPLGRGFLTGQIKSSSDIPDEIMNHNWAIVEALKAVADQVGCTPAQLCLAWVASLGPHVIPLPGSAKASRILENLEAGDLELSSADLAKVNAIIETAEIKGDRYYGLTDEEAHLWR